MRARDPNPRSPAARVVARVVQGEGTRKPRAIRRRWRFWPRSTALAAARTSSSRCSDARLEELDPRMTFDLAPSMSSMPAGAEGSRLRRCAARIAAEAGDRTRAGPRRRTCLGACADASRALPAKAVPRPPSSRRHRPAQRRRLAPIRRPPDDQGSSRHARKRGHSPRNGSPRRSDGCGIAAEILPVFVPLGASTRVDRFSKRKDTVRPADTGVPHAADGRSGARRAGAESHFGAIEPRDSVGKGLRLRRPASPAGAESRGSHQGTQGLDMKDHR